MDHDSGRPASMLRAILWSLVCCATACTGREVPSATSGTAVRQETWSEPENVTSLNSTYNDMYAVLTRDELVVYFTSDRPGGLGGNDLWTATRATVDSEWDPPVNLTELNSAADDSLPMLSNSENVMWFSSTRDGGCGGADLWQTRRQPDGTWSAPIDLGCTVNTSNDEIAPAFYANDDLGVTTLYFGSNRVGGFDVYETSTTDEDLSNATWTTPAIVANINSARRDTRTWIRRDGRELFITSNRPPGPGRGDFDIWTSTREASDMEWSTPVNLGAPINTSADEGSPSLTWDGDTLYFFSTRHDDGRTDRDIWLSHRVPSR